MQFAVLLPHVYKPKCAKIKFTEKISLHPTNVLVYYGSMNAHM